MKARLMCSIVCLGLILCSSAHADTIQINLTKSKLSAAPGSVVTFDASLANLSSTDTMFLNADSWTTTSPFLSVDDTPFFANAPLTLDPNASTGTFALFSVLIDPNTPIGTYDFNSFSIFGGIDGSASDALGGATFSVAVNSAHVPEPTVSLLLVCSGLLAVVRKTMMWNVKATTWATKSTK